MKKTILFSCLLLLFIGCTADPEESSTPPTPERTINSSIVPVEEALDELYDVLGAISKETRSDVRDYTKLIHKIEVSGGSQATRSESCNLPDTMVYVVNFTDDKGFAVLGAHRSLEPVYAITESGSFDADKLNTAIAEAQKRALEYKNTPKTRAESEPENTEEAGTDFAYTLLAEAMVATPRIAMDTVSITYGPWTTNSTVGPLVEVKWNQCYPFNMHMPETNIPQYGSDRSCKGRFPVGCGIIVAAQIMTCVRHPIQAPAATANYNWTYLKSVSNYTNLDFFTAEYDPNSVGLNTRIYTDQLAQVLYHLGVCFNARSGAGGTSVNIDNVVAGLKTLESNYYKIARVAPVSTSIGAIYTNLNANKPMYVRGSSVAVGGHAWVLDGYLNRSRFVTIQRRYGYTGPILTQSTTEYSKLWHLNWGFSGEYDGYFAEAIFNIASRVSQDEVIDTSPHTDIDEYDFSDGNKVILY